MSLYVQVLLALLTPRAAVSQSDLDTVITDRPDFTESSRVVGPRVIQLESGTTLEFESTGDASSRTVKTPLMLVRVGLSRTIELRFSSDGAVFSSLGLGPTRFRRNTAADMEVGAKWVFLDRRAAGFAMAAIPLVSLPVGGTLGTSGTIDPTVKVTWAKSLARGFELAGNYNVSRLGDDLGRYTKQAHSVSLGHDLGLGWAMYWEGFGYITTGRRYPAAWTFNSGVTRGIGRRAQVDVEVGCGLTTAAPDWFIGMGIGLRRAPGRRPGP